MIVTKNDELLEKVREIISIKYIMVVVDKLYRDKLISVKEHELMIKKLEQELDKCYEKGGLLWKKEE